MSTSQEAKRIERGIQCPECFGANVHCRYSPLTKRDDTSKFECRDCGCNWSKKIEGM